jgi:hypothetical protein
MALIINRSCGLGLNHDNYVQISDLVYQIDNLSEYKPIHTLKEEVKIFLNKDSRDLMAFQKLAQEDKSKMTGKEASDYDHLKNVPINPVGTMNFYTRLDGSQKISDLVNLEKLYNDLKENKYNIFGVEVDDKTEKVKDDLTNYSDSQTSKGVIDSIVAKNIKGKK